MLLIAILAVSTPFLANAEEDTIAADLVEIDWVNPPANPPERVSHHTFHSTSMDTEVGYNLYRPPGYDSTQKRYPVVYFLHGRSGHESKHITLAKHLDHAIRSNQVPPMLMVFVNGGRRTGYIDSQDGTVMPETMIIEELIPHIDATYRTLPKGGGRAIEGFSMGSGGALRLILKHSDMFSSAVLYGAGGMRQIDRIPRARHVSGRLKSEIIALRRAQLGNELADWRAANSYYIAKRNRAKVAGRVAIRQVIGTEDWTLSTAEVTQARLLELKIPFEFELLGGVKHNLGVLYRRAGVEGLQFHAEHFFDRGRRLKD
jgi:endo-1,4-beta-xylanase